VSIPNQFAGGLDAYWTEASKTAQPYEIEVPSGSDTPEGDTEPGEDTTTVDPAAAAGAPAGDLEQAPELKSAQKANGRWKGTTKGPVATTVGKVFFDEAGKSWVCSGTVINSVNESVVWTAGHCVHSGAPPKVKENTKWKKHFHTNWVFAPGYRNDKAPYGYWRPRKGTLSTVFGWSKYGSFLYDLGAVVLQKKKGKTIVDVAKGGQGIAFNREADLDYWSFGYPAGKPFNGANLYYCHSPLIGRESPTQWRAWRGEAYKAPVKISGPAEITIRCNMTGGSSGGGWLAGFDQSLGWVTGVNSTGDDVEMTSPYFGDAAAALWDLVNDA
jgi:V8-like Glu-specific endopeptidase